MFVYRYEKKNVSFIKFAVAQNLNKVSSHACADFLAGYFTTFIQHFQLAGQLYMEMKNALLNHIYQVGYGK
jgi:hypothetical protein